ncbi:MAG TPA: C39 family peptidase [Methylomirabilota bacterium]|nr:C39 family peptidase [Methylomirabilota bacterium]
MTSGLWGVVSGLPLTMVIGAIPPACRRELGAPPAPAVRLADDEALIEAPPWPAAGAAHFVPSFTALTPVGYGVRFELSVRVDGRWSSWVASIGLGPAEFAPLPPNDALEVDVDVFRARAPVEAVRVRARVRGAESVLAAPWMLTLSISEPSAPAPAATVEIARATRLDVPALSQMQADAAIAPRICSPTCVAMVLAYWRRPAPLAPLAAEVFHPGSDLYGVWPAAIVAAGRRGLAGYLLRFPDWAAAAWCLEQRLPVIASVRYRAGELSGAAIAETPGHLLALTGWEGDDVLVNDPAAPTAASVPRRYPLREIQRIWLDRTAVGYVLFPPSKP